MNKVKTFGAVPWYDREIDANDREALYKPRDSREYVMRKVLEDLDFASTHCITNAKLEVNSVRITRNVALAFKAVAVSTRALSANTTRTIPRPASRGRPTSRRCTSGPAPTPAKR